MTPFYHPTSILVLDDDPLFLESLDFQFSDELSCQTFTRPDAALEHLQRQDFHAYCPLIRRRLSHARRVTEVLRPFFPSYLFVKIIPTAQRWQPLMSTIGVRSIVR